MEYIGCFDAVDEVVLEATKQYGSQYALNRSFYEKFPEVCDCVDKLFEELDCLSIEVNVYDVPEKECLSKLSVMRWLCSTEESIPSFRQSKCLIHSRFLNLRMGTFVSR